MKIEKKIWHILLNLLPIIGMIALIPFVKDDYTLTALYICIIVLCFAIKYKKNEYIFFVFGGFMMLIAEWFFISTGVETFTRNSLLGIMPLRLPILRAYVFVVMRRTIYILDK